MLDFYLRFFKYLDTRVIKQRHFPPCVLLPLSDVTIKTRLLLFSEDKVFQWRNTVDGFEAVF
jgi:hypothetical protein